MLNYLPLLSFTSEFYFMLCFFLKRSQLNYEGTNLDKQAYGIEGTLHFGEDRRQKSLHGTA